MNKIKFIFVIIVMLLGGGVYIFVMPENNERFISEIASRDNTGSEIKIVAFGDSLTAGYGLSASAAYPAQLEDVLVAAGFDVSVINSGVSGETSRGNLERANFIAKQNPDVVILGIGGNDALRQLSVSETQKNIEQTIDILRNDSVISPVIILLQMQAPLSAGLGYKREFDAIYENISDTKRVILVPFLTSELFFKPENKLADGIHYNQAGYRQAVDLYIFPMVKEVLEGLERG